jgi:hypothetical protein
MSSAKAAARYIERGYAVVPVPARSKNPGRNGWEDLRITLEDVPRYFTNGQNVGIHTGEPSGWLVPVDQDVREVRHIAGRFLLPTLTSGRESTPDSHWWYVAPGCPHKTFKDLDNSMILELRSTGHHTLVEPSVHPSGEAYRWSRSGLQPEEISAEELVSACQGLASAALIARHLPERRDNRTGGGGGRHDLALAIAGFLLRRRLPEETVLKILRAAWDARGFAGDERARREAHRDLEALVPDTAQRVRQGDPATGGRRLDELVPGLPRKLADYWGWGGRLDDGELPKIVVNNRHLREVTTEALSALAARNDPPELFVRSGRLVRVREDENGIPEIQTMEDSHVKGRLARVADFVRTTEKGETRVNPPDWTVKDVQALGRWPFPALEAVVEVPIVRPDGTIVSVPGYDPQTRLYYRPIEGFEVPTIPGAPTPSDTQAAIELLDEAVGEFPYEDRASAANTLALMLTPLVRPAVNGPVPLALIDKPQAGTGGSLLAEAVAVIGSGHTAEMLGAPRDEEEWRKQITAKLAAGATMITVDNVEGALYAPSLARALTARTWTDRVLGRSETITVGQRATWVATGNNIQLRGDLPRRCYSIRLDAREARPWQRENFKHPDLLGWVAKNRGRLIHALLTLARAWFAAGKPKAENVPRLGSFETWTEIVGGMVAFAGIPDFLGNLEELYDKADAGGAEWEGFLYAWWEELDASKPITVADLTKRIDDNDTLKEALPGDLAEAFDKSSGSFSRKLGNALAKRAGTRYGEDGMHIVRAGEFRRAVCWRLDVGSKGCEFVSLVSLINSSAGNIPEEENREGGEKDSTNSQTHTRSRPTPEQERRIRNLVEQGMSEKWARKEVLGEGWAAS